jgi:hypothetical protein
MYGLEQVTTLNEFAFDDQKGDGIFKGTETNNWKSRIKLTPVDWNGAMHLDWENADNTQYPNMLSSMAGFYIGNKIQQDRCAEMVKAIDAVRGQRPNAQIGVYGFPYGYFNAIEDPAGHPWFNAYRNYANICLMGDKPVWPFINYVWFNTTNGHTKNTRIPLDHLYEWVKAWADVEVDGRHITGIVLWNSSSGNDAYLDDPTLRTIRAALDGQPQPK